MDRTMGGSSGASAAGKKKNVTRILALSVVTIAILFLGEFGSDDPGESNYSVIEYGKRQLVQRNAAARAGREGRRAQERKDGRAADRAREREQKRNQPSLLAGIAKLVDFMGPMTARPRVDNKMELQQKMMEVADAAAAEGITTYRVHSNNEFDGETFFAPSEVYIEVVNPKSDCQYSVTVVSPGKYTGTAMLLTEDQYGVTPRVHSWKPTFPGRYEVLVHEIDQTYAHITPLIEPSSYPIFVQEGQGQAPGSGLSMLESRIQDLPPCQTQNDINLFTRWDGDWLGPYFHLENSIREGWSFIPNPATSSMNCKVETFTTEMIRATPEKKSIYILGRSVERGIFLSLVDLLLNKKEKKLLNKSTIGKCWGRATVTKGNLELTYQDFRVNAFEDPTEPRFIECHNEKMVKQPGSSFIANATQVWEEIFKQDEDDWPSVIFLVTGLGASQFKFTYHVQSFVNDLPPHWQGTLFLGDFSFSGRSAGLLNVQSYESYLQEITDFSRRLNDPRVRWLDGNGLSKEMRLYSQKGEEYIARSQHFHHPCLRKDPNNPSEEATVVCSNVTELVGQLLLGHALGPKEEFIERVQQNPNPPDSAVRWCHACPKCMIPFHITAYPEMECVDGPIEEKPDFVDCSAMRFGGDDGGKDRGGEKVATDPMACPAACLENPVTSAFGSETDTVYVRQCPI